jgi:hypothetical protein
MTTSGPQADGWPLDWRGLPPHARWIWWEQLWTDAIRLRDRYRLTLRSPWWEDDVQVETLAALAAWSTAYDAGAWTDPTGKLTLLYDLDRIRNLLRDGEQPFDPDQDRAAFIDHLTATGCQPEPAEVD